MEMGEGTEEGRGREGEPIPCLLLRLLRRVALLLYPLIGTQYSHSACLCVCTSSPRSVGVTAAAWIWGEGEKRRGEAYYKQSRNTFPLPQAGWLSIHSFVLVYGAIMTEFRVCMHEHRRF